MLDRVEKEKETHPGFKRHVGFTYVRLSDQVATEVHDDPSSATPTARDVTKSYGYDAFGLRLSLTNAPAMVQSPSAVGKQGTFTYAYDVHGSVSALVDNGGNVEATYGYDAYGGADPQLTTGDNDPLLQLNAYRYTGKRTDVGSATIDMGARRFSPDSARFLQPDVYGGALSNLGLSMDPLTGNRYGLAACNPVSFVEVDGHMLAKAPGGGGYPGDSPRNPDELGGGGGGGGRGGGGGSSPQVDPQVYKAMIADAESDNGGEPLAPQCHRNSTPSYERFKELVSQCHGGGSLSTDTEYWVLKATGEPYTPGWEPPTDVERMITQEVLLTMVPMSWIGRAARWGGRLVHGARTAENAGDVTRGASSAANAARLTRQLQFDEASSIFTRSGGLQNEVIAASRPIVPGSKLGNPSVIKSLTSDGGSIAQWAKYRTPTFQSPSGPFQVHFYYNQATGAANYAWDYKAILTGR